MRTHSSETRRALLVVDVQKDFCPNGALPSASGSKIIPVINQLLPKFNFVIASKDWHPQETIHFEKWPKHCVRGTEGAAFHEDLHEKYIDLVALKGTGNTDDGYSAFEATNIDLNFELKKRGVEGLIIVGLTTEYCVKATALDASHLGFKVYLVNNAVAPVEEEDEAKALQEMKEAGISIIQSKDVQG
ncbi:MAG TPA: isochorismatase family protein [Chitinophagaceae bacterium]|nr:isochorismatase family protein [Chitinophagaceae bacterium]